MVQGGDALGETALDLVPLGRRDQARQQVIRKDTFRALVAPVDGESDALGKKRKIGRLLPALQFFVRKPRQGLGQSTIVRSQITVPCPHFVERGVERIVTEETF